MTVKRDTSIITLLCLTCIVSHLHKSTVDISTTVPKLESNTFFFQSDVSIFDSAPIYIAWSPSQYRFKINIVENLARLLKMWVTKWPIKWEHSDMCNMILPKDYLPEMQHIQIYTWFSLRIICLKCSTSKFIHDSSQGLSAWNAAHSNLYMILPKDYLPEMQHIQIYTWFSPRIICLKCSTSKFILSSRSNS